MCSNILTTEQTEPEKVTFILKDESKINLSLKQIKKFPLLHNLIFELGTVGLNTPNQSFSLKNLGKDSIDVQSLPDKTEKNFAELVDLMDNM